MDKLYKIFSLIEKKVDEEKSTVEGIFSTSDEDRHGDVVQQVWDLKHFKKNPVILNSHSYHDAAEVIGKATSIKVKDGKLEGKIKFATGENPKAKVIFDMIKGGFLNAFSVGFIPKEFSNKGEILKSELLEVSVVSVPANAMALAKAKGIDVSKLYETNQTKKTESEDGDSTQDDAESTTGDDAQNQGDEEAATEADGDGGKAVREEVEEDGKGDGGGEEVEGEEEAEQEESESGEGDGGDEEERPDSESGAKVGEDTEQLPSGGNEETKKLKALKTIVKAISLVSESSKVETRSKSVRAEQLRLINKGIRKLVILK